MPATPHGPLTLILLLLCVWGLIGVTGLVRLDSIRFAAAWLFPMGAVIGLTVAAAGLWALLGSPASAAAPHCLLQVGLPNLPVHLRLDALSSVFLILLGGVACGVSTFASGYFRKHQGSPPGLVCLQYHVFLASMGFVLIADDAYAFLVAWETMAVSSYFLVITDHRIAAIRSAGFLYLVIAHAGALAILCAFALMQSGAGQSTFDAMRAEEQRAKDVQKTVDRQAEEQRKQIEAQQQ